MHRWAVLICIIFFISTIVFVFLSPKSGKRNGGLLTIKPLSPTPTAMPPVQITQTLFVPYWTLSSQQIDQTSYNNIVYFGVTVNADGIDTQEDGYKDINTFLSDTSSQKGRLLGIRMITSDINAKVVADKDLQEKVIQQSISLAKEKGFDGIVLDFEISALGFDKITNEITFFEDTFADVVKQQHLVFYTTVYGDTFVRFRPFDVKTIAQHADGIMIMAYDFHKANGDPGPNFPFSETVDGYGFSTMVSDFLAVVPATKTTVIFGLFGYDWTLNGKGESITQAASLSNNEIKQEFLDTCAFTNCKITTDPATQETHIDYTDTDGKSHVVWFEDMQSIAKKIDLLKSKHIGSVGYWAYSYF